MGFASTLTDQRLGEETRSIAAELAWIQSLICNARATLQTRQKLNQRAGGRDIRPNLEILERNRDAHRREQQPQHEAS